MTSIEPGSYPAMKLTLRTNEDDWRELTTDGLNDIGHAGHDVPEHVWINILKAAGVEVEVVFDDFGVHEEPEWSVDHPGIGVVCYPDEQAARTAAGTAGTVHRHGRPEQREAK